MNLNDKNLSYSMNQILNLWASSQLGIRPEFETDPVEHKRQRPKQITISPSQSRSRMTNPPHLPGGALALNIDAQRAAVPTTKILTLAWSGVNLRISIFSILVRRMRLFFFSPSSFLNHKKKNVNFSKFNSICN